MKTIVINTSNEAKNTKLDILFKAPCDGNSLLWKDSRLSALEENVQAIKQYLLEEADAVDRDYQLIVLVDLYEFPMGNDKKTTEIYRQLVERYIYHKLAEPLCWKCNLMPQGMSVFFVDSARENQWKSIAFQADNIKEQEAQEKAKLAQEEKLRKRSISGELTDELPDVPKPARKRTEYEQIVMNLFGWTEKTENNAFSWSLKASAAGNETLDFSEVFEDTVASIAKSHKSAKVLEIALQGVLAPKEEWKLTCVGRFPVYTPVQFVSRENEQSKLEGFFCVFVNIFTCVQEQMLFSQATVLDKEQICALLVKALKKYKYFSAEENIQVQFEPIIKVFEQRKTILDKRKKEVKGRNEFAGKTDEEVADIIMSEFKPRPSVARSKKLRGLDRTFYGLTEKIFDNYDEDIIRAQNNRIVKCCLERLWSWRDKQTREDFKATVDATVPVSGNLVEEPAEKKRETITFLKEEYEKKRDELIDQVTDAEKKLAGNDNILLETKDLMLEYGDWMRKGMWSWVSFVGAVFTVFATVFPFFYTDFSIGNTGLSFHVNVFSLVAICAFLYSVAVSVYIAYINRKKRELVQKLDAIHKKSEAERKESIIALYRYYNETIVEAESYSLLWQEILRRDRENAKKGVMRNYHIKRLKDLAEQVKQFITMMKLDVTGAVEVDSEDMEEYAKMRLQINGEESFYQQNNSRVYRLLPEKNTSIPKKGDTEEV